MTQAATFTKAEYFIIVWVLFAIALACFCSRLWIRLKLYSHLKIDDYLVVFAFLCLLTANILEAAESSNTYRFQDVLVFHQHKPSNYEDIASQYARQEWANAYLFFTGTWAIKGSFLAFYDSLTQRLPVFRRAWWAIVVITILTYIGSLFAYGFLDGVKFKTNLKNEAIIYQFSADCTTDILITIMPVSLALKSRVPPKQKLALAGIFSLTLIITVFSIIRFVLNGPWRADSSPSWIGTWSTIEQSVSVIVACLASFRTWVIANNRSTAPRSYKAPRQGGDRGETPPRRAGVNMWKSFRSYGAGSSRAEGSMDIELLDAQAQPPVTVAKGNVEEPATVAVRSVEKRNLESV